MTATIGEVPGATERLRFRRYRLTDAAAVETMFADDQARRFYGDMGGEGAQRWIDWNLQNYGAYGFGLWVVEELASGAFVGDCGLTYQRAEGRRMLEIGYHVVAERRGRGYATEAGLACRGYALETLAVESVCSIVDPRNDPSIAVAGRIHDSSREFTDDRGERMLLFSTARRPA